VLPVNFNFLAGNRRVRLNCFDVQRAMQEALRPQALRNLVL
jgi:hypothetical protein